MSQVTKDLQASPLPKDLITVRNVHLPFEDNEQARKRWTIECSAGRVSKISPSNVQGDTAGPFEAPTESLIDGTKGLLLPSLCHSHIHLDKCFIFDRCGPLISGDFSEAMKVTNIAKSTFPNDLDDVYTRGARIIRESVEHGVTAMRTHVEIDTSVQFACLHVAQKLQEKYRSQCDVQIAIFAQEPLFSSKDDQTPGENLTLLATAASYPGISVIGSAPYVEPSIEQAKKNINLVFDIADARGLDLVDFHLDYNLDPTSEPLIYEVIAEAKRRYQCGARSINLSTKKEHAPVPVTNGNPDLASLSAKRPCPHITIGHATRLQLFSADEWKALADAISELPITLVGLPQSDMYMQGRAYAGTPLGAPRSTLRVPYLANKYGVEVAMSVNNVENAFTPQGSLDPLTLCTFGVGIFQAATPEDIRTLARSVTITSQRAIGLKDEDIPNNLVLEVGDPANFVVLHGRTTLQSAILQPCFDRTTVKAGKLAAYTRSTRWFSS
ncbi:Metallo-dependent hydrolase [Pholiota conissans]|uniref:Metallo-dependent hydrolase n=1 Tax=Pholiota conissans TaxID=109636 RepID=A0A9P6CZC1_9AGAR|nr:Metallo-dependent hydrolase [Pholiota conissans]